jgi:hypothetical protein
MGERERENDGGFDDRGSAQVGYGDSAALGFLPTLREIVRKDGALALYK